MLNNIKCSRFSVFHFLLLYLCFFDSYCANDGKSIEQMQIKPVGIGVILDMKSSFGGMVNLCIDMAISDFYSAHPNYRTRLQPHKKDAKGVRDVNSAVLDLVKHKEVIAILGPRGSIEETFAAAVGENVGLPIVSFTSRSSALSHKENHYFVRTTLDDSFQAQGLAAICQRFKWKEVVILYEDTEYGNYFLCHLIKAFQDVDIGLAYMTSISSSTTDTHLLKELEKLKTKQKSVFLVHMNHTLGSRLFELANKAGMMSQGYAWVITDSLSIFLNSIDPNIRDSMDGVIGIRPYILATKDLKNFEERWKRKITTVPIMELSVYGLWAYDAITALAIAVENTFKKKMDNTGLRLSSFGPKLLSKLSSTKFKGLAGDFQLVEGTLKPIPFEIFNIIGTGEKTVGFWTLDREIIRELSVAGDSTYLTSAKELKTVVWPGDSILQPKGYPIPTTKFLRIGVPSKPGFHEFVNIIAINAKTNQANASGFAIDIFWAVLDKLTFDIKYEFLCYNESFGKNWSYDNMLRKIPKEYDMVVADTTIWASRSKYVDFSLPYSESGSVMVVKNKKPLDMWIFVKPLSWDLWLAIFVACILMGVVLHVLEHRDSNTSEESIRPQAERRGMIYLSPIAILAFPERNTVSNNWSVFVLVCWLFMAFILMQSFTANLSAILTVDQLNFAISEDSFIGYQNGSYTKDFLTEQLGIKDYRLKAYASAKEFHDAMTKGSKNGGIDAIFDEIPYMKLFINRYGLKYKMVEPTYRTAGFGFAFPKDSYLVAHFSRAILNVTQGPKMNYFEQKNFGPGYSSQDPQSSRVSQGTSSLTLREFAGLFFLIGSLTLFALFCSEIAVGRKFVDITGHFIHNCFSFRTSSQVRHSTEGVHRDGDSQHGGSGRTIELTGQDIANAPAHPVEGDNGQLVPEPARQDGEEIDEQS